MSDGVGTSQFGGDQTLPGAFSVLRNNWQEARAMLMPPEKNSASTTLMRRPSRTSLVLTSIGVVDVRQPEHVDRQPRRHEIVGAVALLDRRASRPMMTRPCSEFGSHGPLRGRRGNEGVAVARVKKG